MGIERVSHYIDNVLTEAQARMGLRDTRLLVTWYTNRENKRSVVHSHPYHELVLPIGGSTVRYSVDGSVYLVHVGELVYFPSQVYHSGNFNIDDDQSDRLVVQIDDALWQATRRRVNLKNTGWLQQLTVLDSEACRKWDFAGLFVRMGQSLELPGSIRDTVFEAQVSEMMLLITQATGSGQTGGPAHYHTVSFLYLLYQTMDLFAIRQRLFVSQLIRRTAGSIDMIVSGIIHLGLHDQIIIEVHCHHSFQVGVIFILTSNYFSILLRHCQYVVIIKITSKQKRRSGYEIFYPP